MAVFHPKRPNKPPRITPEPPVGAMTVNETRRALGLEPIPDIEYLKLIEEVTNGLHRSEVISDEWHQDIWPERYSLKCDYCQQIQPGDWDGGPCRYCGAPLGPSSNNQGRYPMEVPKPPKPPKPGRRLL